MFIYKSLSFYGWDIKVLSLLTALLCIFLCDVAYTEDLELQERSKELLASQRGELLKLAPFRLTYKLSRISDPKDEPSVLPEKTGTAILTQDGRFIINEVTAGSESYPEKSRETFAWDGNRIYASQYPGQTLYLARKDFAQYMEIGDVGSIPCVDMYSGATGDGGEPLSYRGMGVRLLGLHVFDYMALYDMYYSRRVGMLPPVRWCDVADDGFFSVGCLMPSLIKEDRDGVYVSFRPREGVNLRSKAGYYMQMKMEPHSSQPSAYRAEELTHRGYWRSVVETSADTDVFSKEEFAATMRGVGSHIQFTYSDKIAGGWLPASVKQTNYYTRQSFKSQDIAVTDLSFDKNSLIELQVEWEVIEFERLDSSEVQPILDQFVMMQKQLFNVADQ